MNEKNKFYYASLNKRLTANAIDITILGLILLFDVFLVPASIKIFYLLLLYLYLFLFPSLFRGQTLGKLLAKIKIVDYKTKNNITLKQVHIRELSKFFFIIVSVITAMHFKLFHLDINLNQITVFHIVSIISSFIAIIFILTDLFLIMEQHEKRGLHDKIAKTIVIDINFQEKTVYDDDDYEFKLKTK